MVSPQDTTHPDQPTARWREGPVRYIITAEEDREFKELTSDDARHRFIERFWFRRDPESRTLVNEYRLEFWRRVAASNRLFTESSKPGWKTDMGRYYILLGAPDDRDTSLELAPGLGRTGVRGAITWSYSHAPSPSLGTGIRIVFTKDPSGEYRTESNPRIVQDILDNRVLSPVPSLADFGIPLGMLSARMSELQLMLDLGRLEEVPTEDDLLTGIVSAEEFFGVIPFSARYDFFLGTGHSTIVALTLSVHPDPLDPGKRPAVPDYLIVGRIDAETPLDTQDRGTLLHESDFSASSLNDDPRYPGPYLFQSVASLRAGRYRVSFAAFDRARHKTGSFSEILEVPSFEEDRLSLSSLCLSSAIEQAAVDSIKPEPYVIGHLKVTPRLIPTYRNGETFAVYYQVYSALDDPATHAPNLQIEYQFLVSQAGGYIPIGRSIHFESVGNSAQGWSFPMRDWPAADFRLRVTVTDTLTGQVASREVAFKVL
jgi:GWxTD domain-containing protein